jgi:signal transduction histidine kinase
VRRGPRLAALRAPLAVKVIGANLLVVTVLAMIWLGVSEGHVTVTLGIIVALLLAVHLGLVLVALRPVRDLESLASRVWKGDYGARYEASAVADQEVLRVGSMFNVLLDGLESDRARMRALATQVIEIGDRERAALARELHDSTAQRLAALLLQISAAARDAADPSLAARLADIRDAAEEVTEEVRLLAQTVHPRVLDDLGLKAALMKLARDAAYGTKIDIQVDAPDSMKVMSLDVAAVLYRVAQESVHNAVRHASPRHVRVALRVGADEAILEVADDGRGFNVEDARPVGGMGLYTMRERVELVDGDFEVRSAIGGGTTVTAAVPLSDDSPKREEI